MDARVSTPPSSHIVTTETAPRPTATPSRVTFGQVLAASASGLVQGAELAVASLPGSPWTAAAVRGSGPARGSADGTSAWGVAPLNTSPEGPSATGAPSPGLSVPGLTSGATGTGGSDPTGGIDASLQQSAQMNMYYLQVQQQIDSENRVFTALSNVIKTEHDSAKAAIQNIHA